MSGELAILTEALSRFTGYRMDGLYSGGNDSLATVVPYELKRGTIPRIKGDIDVLLDKGYTKVVWLMNTVDELSLYDSLQDDRDWNSANFDIDKWDIKLL
jgi:hypothetical protein